MNIEKVFHIGSKVALITGLFMGGIALGEHIAAVNADQHGFTELANELETDAFTHGSLAIAEFGASLAMSASVKSRNNRSIL